jgi:hypothetical protein
MLKITFEDETRSGKWVRQLLEAIAFAYDLHLGHSRDHWKGLSEEYNIEKGLQHSLMYGEP